MNQAESERLLKDCRELLTGRMRSSMARMLGDVEDVLFDMATGGGVAGPGTDYIDAVREIRMKKREIQIRFENRLLDRFEHIVSDVQNALKVPATARQNVTYAVVDFKRARSDPFDQHIEKVRGECRDALIELDRHVGRLLQAVPDSPFDNPLAPHTVFNAFRESCRDIPVGAEVRHILLDRFDRHIGPVLQSVYTDLNRLLQSYDSSVTGQPLAALVDPGYRGDISGGQATGDSVGMSSLLVGHWIRERVLVLANDPDLPEFVRDFLLGPWTLVLERLYHKYGESSPEWNRALQVMTDLQQGTRWTGDKETRKQQIWMLPGLVYRLKNGMKMVSIPLKQQADFLSRLKSHHASIIESGPAPAQREA